MNKLAMLSFLTVLFCAGCGPSRAELESQYTALLKIRETQIIERDNAELECKALLNRLTDEALERAWQGGEFDDEDVVPTVMASKEESRATETQLAVHKTNHRIAEIELQLGYGDD